MKNSVNQSNLRDRQQLEKMLVNYEKLEAKLADPDLPHPDRQSIGAALVMLKEFITAKIRDLKRK
jgi:hypothetical protein